MQLLSQLLVSWEKKNQREWENCQKIRAKQMPQISKRGFRILKPQEFDFHSQQHSKGYSSLDNLYALSREIGDHQRPAGDCQK